MTLTADANDNTANLVNIIRSGWTAANTDGKTPVVNRIQDVATPMTKDLQQADFILIYSVGYQEEYIDLGAANVRSMDRYSIDIRTINGQGRLRKLWKEARRVLWSKRVNPTDGSGAAFPFNFIIPLSRMDLTDKSKGLFRMVYDVELRRQVEKVMT